MSSGSGERTGTSRRLSVLLIEDSKTYAQLATAQIENLGHSITVAGSAEEGLAFARAHPPSVVLMDIHLPGMDGYAAARAFREEFTLRSVPVIGISLSEPMDHDTTQQGIAAGFRMHLGKPMKESEFRYLFEAYVPMAEGHPDADR